MKLALICAMAFWAAGSAVAQAEGPGASGVVVELYTSQGCSSCPPADEVLTRIAAEPGVIALSLHVDYWDYIGWVDHLALPQFTDRQKAYAKAEGSRTIYTPQMVVGGVHRIEGTDPEALAEALRAHLAMPAAADLRLARKGDAVTITAPALAKPPQGAIRVQLVRYIPHVQVMIEKGENAGKLVDYTNVVTSWQVLGQWDGVSALNLQAQVPGPEAVVVILQAEGMGPILAARRSD